MIFHKPLGSDFRNYYYWYVCKVWKRSVDYFFSYRACSLEKCSFEKNEFKVSIPKKSM